MILTTHIKTNEEWRSLANARDIGAARDILNVVERARDRLRKQAEGKPEDELAHIKLAKIFALNWVLDLPRKAMEHINNSEGE